MKIYHNCKCLVRNKSKNKENYYKRKELLIGLMMVMDIVQIYYLKNGKIWKKKKNKLNKI